MHVRLCLCLCLYVLFAYFSEPDTFEWYQEFGALRHILSRYVTKQSGVLVLGCGTSALGEEIHRAGAKQVLQIDFSPVAIDVCKKKYNNTPGMQCTLTGRHRRKGSTRS
jgi:2-polyprenyl-3-methyl-5-hydroxy-6-metoxy-1,4-benzoquinol methylase